MLSPVLYLPLLLRQIFHLLLCVLNSVIFNLRFSESLLQTILVTIHFSTIVPLAPTPIYLKCRYLVNSTLKIESCPRTSLDRPPTVPKV
jgi:hypothetical protein